MRRVLLRYDQGVGLAPIGTDQPLGAFSLEDSVFLVVWELNLILEFSPGSWIFFPSALLTHFNVSAAGMSSAGLPELDSVAL